MTTYCELCGSEIYQYGSAAAEYCPDCRRVRESFETAVTHAGERGIDIVEWVRKVVKTQIAAALKEKV